MKARIAFNADHWRKRVEEMRSVANRAPHQEDKTRLLALAAEFEHFAERAAALSDKLEKK